jgi:hypothetical protein
MAQTWDEALAFMRRIGGDGAEEMLRQRMTRLDGVVSTLRLHPFSASIRMFGSVVHEPDQVPGDMDIFVDLRDVELSKEARQKGLRTLLDLAVEGGNYGLFDPFVLNRQGVLYTRSEAYTRSTVSWCRAGNAEAIVAAGCQGMPLNAFQRCFSSQFLASPEPPFVSC